MGSSFGKTNAEIAKEDLVEQITRINTHINFLQLSISTRNAEAKKSAKLGDRHQALLHLKLKKHAEQMRVQALSVMYNLVTIRDNLEMQESMGRVASSMKNSLEVMKTMTKGKDIESIEEMMEEFDELEERTKLVIPDILPDEESALEEELRQLTDEITTEQLKSISVPNKEPVQENKELNALFG